MLYKGFNEYNPAIEGVSNNELLFLSNFSGIFTKNDGLRDIRLREYSEQIKKRGLSRQEDPRVTQERIRLFRIYKQYIDLDFVYSPVFTNLPTTTVQMVGDIKIVHVVTKASDMSSTSRLNREEF